MEDGYCLARCLSAYFHQNANSLEHFLRIYEQCRFPRTTAVQASSREAGKLYEQQHAEMRGIVNEEERYRIMGEKIEGRMRWLWEYDIDAETQEALMLPPK